MVDLSDAAFVEAGLRPDRDCIFGAGADLKQGFYQMTWRAMGSWFGFDYPEKISAFGTTTMYCDEVGHDIAVGPDTLVFPVYKGSRRAGPGRCFSATW